MHALVEDDLPRALQGKWGVNFFVFCLWFPFMFPLTFPRRINALRFTSTAGIIIIIAFCFVVVVHAATSGRSSLRPKERHYATASFKTLSAFTIFIYAYMFQSSTFLLWTELKTQTVTHMNNITMGAVAITSVLYLMVGVGGFLEYGSDIESNLMSNYDPKEPLIAVSFVLLAFVLVTSFPLSIMPTRESIISIAGFAPNIDDDESEAAALTETEDTKGRDPPPPLPPKWLKYGLGPLLAIIALILSFFIPNIGLVVGLVGGVSGGMLGFVLPAVYVFRTGEWTPAKQGWTEVVACVALIVFGILGVIFGTVFPIIDFVKYAKGEE